MLVTTNKKQVFNREIMFVLKALSKEPLPIGRLDLVAVTKDHLVASDGHRLHKVRNALGWQPGYYKLVKKTATTAALDRLDTPIEYPGFDTIISVANNPKLSKASFFCPQGDPKSNELIAQIDRALPLSLAIDPDHVREAAELTDWVSIVEDKGFIVMAGAEALAIIMCVECGSN